MRRNSIAAFFIVITTLIFALPGVAQSRYVFWKEWDVLIDNVDVVNNRFDVTESYDIDFSGQFRFGSAVIPLTNLTTIRNVSVSENGRALERECSERNGTFCVENTSDGLSITYYFFNPIDNDSQRFEIRYTVEGALRIYEGGDQLWWVAIPPEHFGFPIGSATITVEMPAGYGPREGVDPVETYGAPGQINVQGTTITAIVTRQIEGDESFEIRVQYPHHPDAQPASWQASFDEQRNYDERTRPLLDLGLIAISLLLALGGVVGLYALWYMRGRDPQVGPVPTYLTEPPSALRPAIAGTLLDETADMRDVMSTILDLAQRGYLVIEEQQTEGLFGIKSNSFTFKRSDKATSDLQAHERRLFDALFSSGRMERTLESLRNSFYRVVPTLKSDLYSALVTESLFTTSPQTTRSLYSSIGVVLLVIAGLFMCAASELGSDLSNALFCVPMSLGAVGFLALITGQYMPAKTRKGAEEAAKWRAFREYLVNLEKYADVEQAASKFEQYLPYATAFGLDRAWIRRFASLSNAPIPNWYYPTYLGGRYRGGYTAGTPIPRPNTLDLARAPGDGLSLDNVSSGLSGGLENISNGLTSMLDSASRAMTSQPQQSQSSGRWSSGGRGWSGGGGFRGGGSGGGSRGFG